MMPVTIASLHLAGFIYHASDFERGKKKENIYSFVL